MIDRAELCVQMKRTLNAGLHDRLLVDVVGKKPRQIAAELRSPGAAGLGQEAQELAQSDETDGVDDLAALAGGTDKPRLLEGAEVKRERRRGDLEGGGDIAGRHARRSLRGKKPDEPEPRLLRKHRKTRLRRLSLP